MQLLSREGGIPVVTTAAWVTFFLRAPPFSLVSSLHCHPRSIPGFPLQLSTKVLLYLMLCLFIACWSSFYLQFGNGDIVGAADICSCHWSGQAIWLASWWQCLVYWPLISWILCFLNTFWWRKAAPPRINLHTEHKSKWAIAQVSFHDTQLICIFHSLVATWLISTSSIEGNTLYFDVLTTVSWLLCRSTVLCDWQLREPDVEDVLVDRFWTDKCYSSEILYHERYSHWINIFPWAGVGELYFFPCFHSFCHV